jgi:hypothetical protein
MSLLFGGRFIDALRKWNVGQQIRGRGRKRTWLSGTPTMGGVLIVGSVVCRLCSGAFVESVRLDHDYRDAVVCGDRLCRRLPEDGQAEEPWSNWPAKASRATD